MHILLLLCGTLICFWLYVNGVKDRRIGTKDLRLKLQKKSVQQTSQSGNGSVSGVRDLREKLSGETYLRPVDIDPMPKPVLESSKPVRKSVIVETPEPEIKKVASSVPKQKAHTFPFLLLYIICPLAFTTVIRTKFNLFLVLWYW